MIGKLMIAAAVASASVIVVSAVIVGRRSGKGSGPRVRPRPTFVPSDSFYIPHNATWGNR